MYIFESVQSLLVLSASQVPELQILDTFLSILHAKVKVGRGEVQIPPPQMRPCHTVSVIFKELRLNIH